MNETEIFYQDKAACRSEFTHVTGEVTEAPLAQIDELYGAADVLSIRFAEEHRRVLLALSIAGTLLTMSFLLYDEAEMHGLILACGAMIVFLFLIHHISERLECHRKYIQYRVLAECLRVQFFLTLAGVKTKAADMLPWSVRKGIPWLLEVLNGIDFSGTPEKRPILDCWVRTQRKYHQQALKKAEIKNQRDGRVAGTVFVITIVSYLITLVYELAIYGSIAGTAHADLIRAALKILLGTMSAATLFMGGYYGKMSLSNIIDDHKRMISLYETAEEEISEKGESEELILLLAREFLNENSTWYAYQSKNKADIVV